VFVVFIAVRCLCYFCNYEKLIHVVFHYHIVNHLTFSLILFFSNSSTTLPSDAYTPEKCALNQEGPVWFLADQLGGREERTCTIPAGKAIFVPLLVGVCDYSLPDVKSDEDLRRCAMEGNEYGVIEATVDGVKLKSLEKYRTQSGFFNMTIPEDNIYNSRAGTFRALTDGFFVFLEPLPHGKHDVHLKVSVLNPIEQQYNYNADWTYHLIIAKPTNSTK
jgi:hypothetical protein